MTEIQDKYEHLRIHSKKEIEEPVPFISIGENVISTQGQITIISGAIKSGKSSLCCVLIAGAIRNANTPYEGFESLNILPDINERAILHFDTEQSHQDHQRNIVKYMLMRINLTSEPEYFGSFNLRSEDISKRQNIVAEICRDYSQKYNGIHMIFVDGVADFVSGVNEEIESNHIVDFFDKLAMKYNCPVVLFLHLNPNSTKQRGHMGSQLQRKAESVLNVIKENEISTLQPAFLRNASKDEVPIIRFRYDKDKRYHIYHGIKRTKYQMGDDFKTLAVKIFSKEPIRNKDATQKICDITGKSNRTAQTYLENLLKKEFIIKNADGNYLLNPSFQLD